MKPAKICVKCRSVEMGERTMGQAVAGSCPQCHGLWFGHGALDMALNQPGLCAKLAARDHCCHVCAIPAELSAVVCASCGATLHGFDCPEGHGRLKQVFVGGIVVEVCPMCDGVFLDRGELSKVHAAATATRCANCEAELPDPDAGYLVDRGRICGRCFRKRAAKHAKTNKKVDEVLDSMLDTLFSTKANTWW